MQQWMKLVAGSSNSKSTQHEDNATGTTTSEYDNKWCISETILHLHITSMCTSGFAY